MNKIRNIFSFDEASIILLKGIYFGTDQFKASEVLKSVGSHQPRAKEISTMQLH